MLLPGYFNIRSLPHAIFIPTWLNLASFWLQKPTNIASSRRLGASWARLGASWAHLGASWRRLRAFWARLGAKNSVLRRLGRVLNSIMLRAVQARCSAWPQGTNKYQRRNSTAGKLPTDLYKTLLQRTLTRSWAPSGPVRVSNAQQSCDPATALNC